MPLTYDSGYSAELARPHSRAVFSQLASDNTFLYGLWDITNPRISKSNSNGSLVSGADRFNGTNISFNVNNPPTPSSFPVGSGVRQVESFTVSNNKFYILWSWNVASSADRYSIEIYNLSTGAYESRLVLLSASISFFPNEVGVAGSRVLLQYNTGIAEVNTTTGDASIIARGSQTRVSLAVSQTRIWQFLANNVITVVYFSEGLITGDTGIGNTTSTIAFDSIAIIGNGLYGIDAIGNAAGRNRLFRYTGVPVPVVATGRWTGVAGGSSLNATLNIAASNITGLTTDDIQILNASDVVQSGWTIAIGSSTIAKDATTSITATPPANTNASFKIRLKATSLMSGGSFTNNSPAANVTSSAVSVSNVVVRAVAAWEDVSGGTVLTGKLRFSQSAISGLAITDIQVLDKDNVAQTGWTIVVGSETAAINTTVSITATPPSGTDDEYKLSLKANSVMSTGSAADNSPVAAVTTSLILVDNVITVSNVTWSAVSGGPVISGTLTFSDANIVGLEPSDFEVLTATNQLQSGWTIKIKDSSVLAGGNTQVFAMPPEVYTPGSYKIRLKKLSIRSDGSTTDNAPASSVITDAVGVILSDGNIIPLAFINGTTTLKDVAVYTIGSNTRYFALTDAGLGYLDDLTSPNYTAFTEAQLGTTQAPWGSAQSIFIRENELFITRQSGLTFYVYTLSKTDVTANPVYNRQTRSVSNTKNYESADGTVTFYFAASNTNIYAITDETGSTETNNAGTYYSTVGTASEISWPAGLDLYRDTRWGNLGAGVNDPVGLTYHRNFLYFADNATNETYLMDTGTATGMATEMGSYAILTDVKNLFSDGTLLYAIDATRLYQVNYTPPPFLVWGPIQVNATTRVLTSVATFESTPEDFDTTDFIVEKRGQFILGAYSWATDPNWTISTSGTGLVRTINATPNLQVSDGNYRLVALEDAFGTDKPERNVRSNDITVTDSREALTVTSFMNTLQDPTAIITSSTVNFVINFSHAIRFSELTVSDFEITALSGGNVVTIGSLSPISGTHTQFTFTAQIASRTQGVASISLKANSVTGTLLHKPGPITSVESSQPLRYDLRRQASATWSNIRFEDGLLKGDLVFHGSGVGGLTPESFRVLDINDVVQNDNVGDTQGRILGGDDPAWIFRIPDNTAFPGEVITIEAGSPISQNFHQFKLRLNRLGAISDGGLPNSFNTPVIATDSAPATVTVTIDPTTGTPNRISGTWNTPFNDIAQEQSTLQGGTELRATLQIFAWHATADNRIIRARISTRDIGAEDFIVIGSTNLYGAHTLHDDWDINVTASGNPGQYIVRAIPPTGVGGNFGLRLKAVSFNGASAGAVTGNAYPLEAIDTDDLALIGVMVDPDQLPRTFAPTIGTVHNVSIFEETEHRIHINVRGNPHPELAIVNLADLPTGIAVSGTTISIPNTITVTTDISYTVHLRANNFLGTSDRTFRIIFLNRVGLPEVPHSEPSIAPIDNVSIFERETVSIPLVITGNPYPDVRVIGMFADLSGTPGNYVVEIPNTIDVRPNQSETETVIVEVQNISGLARTTFDVTITDPGTSSATVPTMRKIETVTINEGQEHNIYVFVTGNPKPALSITNPTALPSGITLDGIIIKISDTIEVSRDTAYTIGLRAANSVGSVTQSFTLNILNTVTPEGPLTSPSFGPLDNVTMTEGVQRAIPIIVSGNPSPVVTIVSPPDLPSAIAVLGNNIIVPASVTLTMDTTYNVGLRATNTEGTSFISFNLTIRNRETSALTAPSFDTINNVTVPENTETTINININGNPNPTISIDNLDQLPDGISITDTIISLPDTISVDATTSYTVELTATNSLGSDTASFLLTIVQVPVQAPLRPQGRTFPFLKTIDLSNTPVTTDPRKIFLAANSEHIYFLDDYSIRTYNMDGTQDSTNSIELGDENYAGFEIQNDMFFTIVPEQLLRARIPIYRRINTDDFPEFSIPLYTYGSIITYDSNGATLFRGDLRADLSSRPGSAAIIAGITITFGQSSPFGLAYVSEEIGVVSIGLGHDPILATRYFEIEKVPRMFQYPTTTRPQVNTSITGLDLRKQVYDMTSYSSGVAILQELAGERQWIIRCYSNNFVYDDDLTFPLHEDNTNPLGLAWNGAAIVVYDRSGKFYFYGRELPSPTDPPTDPPPEPPPDPEEPTTEPPSSGGPTPSDASFPSPYKQYTSRFRSIQMQIDMFRQVGSDYQAVFANVSAVVSTAERRLDFSSELALTTQQKYYTIIPQYILPEAQVGYICSFHEPNLEVNEVRSVLSFPPKFRIESINRLVNGFQSFVAIEID